MNINEISKGIPHIEDLHIYEIISIVENIGNYAITEKIDGAQILFGIDKYGFYTSRESKGGKRIYTAEDYALKFSSTYMRSAHLLLESVLPDLKGAGLKVGDQVEAEVLYGQLPNVVPYSADTNYLIFLRTTEGTVNIDRLKQKLNGHSLSIALDTPFTPDGRTIQLREEINTWEFARVPQMPVRFIKSRKLVEKIKKYLTEPSGIYLQDNASIYHTPLNKCPTWCEPQDWKITKILVKEKKEEINEHIDSYNLKECILNESVRQFSSHFGPPLKEGGFIEGIVITDDFGRMFKIVDKDHFGKLRVDAWNIRNSLTESARSTSGNLSFLGELYVSLATSLGHAELGTMQAKKYMRAIGDINESIIPVLAGNTKFKTTQDYWINYIELKETELEKKLDKYATEDKVFAKIHGGFMLSDAVHKRTMETFAETFEKLSALKEATVQARSTKDLLKILIGKHLT